MRILSIGSSLADSDLDGSSNTRDYNGLVAAVSFDLVIRSALNNNIDAAGIHFAAGYNTVISVCAFECDCVRALAQIKMLRLDIRCAWDGVRWEAVSLDTFSQRAGA